MKLDWRIVLLVLAGCSRGGPSPDTRADAQTAFDAAIHAYSGKQYEPANESFTQALESPGLNADQYVAAYTQRAIARAHLKQFVGAHADLDLATEGAADMAQVHLARAFVLEQEGNSNQARQEFNKARRLNPRSRRIKP